MMHKIKYLLCRFYWWLRVTEKARRHYEALKDYYWFYDLYNKTHTRFLQEHRRKPEGELTLRLKGQVELLAEIADIKQ